MRRTLLAVMAAFVLAGGLAILDGRLIRARTHHRPGGASRLAALLLPQILPVSSVVAPCHPGAALRNPLHN